MFVQKYLFTCISRQQASVPHPMQIYIHVYFIYIYMCIYTCTHVYIYIYMCTNMCVYSYIKYVCIFVHKRLLLYVCTRIWRLCTNMCVHEYVCIFVHKRLFTCSSCHKASMPHPIQIYIHVYFIYIHMYIYTCAHIHIHVYTYIRTMHVYSQILVERLTYTPKGLSASPHSEVGGWGRDPKKCTGRDWGMGSSTI